MDSCSGRGLLDVGRGWQRGGIVAGMQKAAGFGLSGCSQRRFLLLLVLQLVAVGLVITVLQHFSTDFVDWLPQTLDPGNEWELNVDPKTALRNSKLPFAYGTRDLNEAEPDAVGASLPYGNELSRTLERRNNEPARNRDLFPELAGDHIPIVLYVHNRPQYLQLVIDSLSKVRGIEETILIVSHDGFFPEMNSIIEGIRFCQVKQIFAPFSPHLFPTSFPGQAPEDCRDKENPNDRGCVGNPDQYGNHRSTRIVSLKHHWWWMMNSVWDGLAETRNRDGNVLFIEEDHFLLPNAYRSIQMLAKLKSSKCPECVAVNLAPVDVNSRGEGFQRLVIEKVGNMGYSFNRTTWNWIHAMAKPFCMFDDYNWDITMWAVVYPSFPTAGYTLRGPKTSAIHFGKCGLHQGQDKGKPLCKDSQDLLALKSAEETEPYLNADWSTLKYSIRGYNAGFGGWGGWGDKRDQQLCLDFSTMYHRSSAN